MVVAANMHAAITLTLTRMGRPESPISTQAVGIKKEASTKMVSEDNGDQAEQPPTSGSYKALVDSTVTLQKGQVRSRHGR